ncbi:hypothetical protein [Streptomyces wuyuanensis]|uniref:Uncharacterized protein n=1 Tax=Streptomyces wuyuanensis TaxID=1196353 RepID=A0A1H0EGB5_9ACTN|nr:hypothetical protein [Streptomyces wuyuanensis]SDN81316.1 hypothetical protein SAMN05444921_1445 [Streptomyces wuyuanensis]
MTDRIYTSAERRRRAGLILRGSKKALAGIEDARIDRAIDRIDDAATERYGREAAAARQQLEKAKQATAAARVAERAAKREDRQAARKAREAAQDAERRAERAARHYR